MGEFLPLWAMERPLPRLSADLLAQMPAGGRARLVAVWHPPLITTPSEGRRPYASINFITCHDGFILRDTVAYDTKHNEANKEFNPTAATTTGPGTTASKDQPTMPVDGPTPPPHAVDADVVAAEHRVPMISAGDEFGRTQGRQ